MPDDATQDCDLLVIGAGAAGLTAAVTAASRGLRVIVAEKTGFIGGTTALSEGMVWVPLSSHARRSGIADSEKTVLAYIQAAAGPRYDAARAQAYVRNAAPMLDLIEARTPARFTLSRYSLDYHQDLPGATTGARAFNPGLFDGGRLGDDFRRLRPPLASTMILGGMTIASSDLAHFFAMTRSAASFMHVGKVAARYGLDRLAGHARGTRIANGNGLIGALFLALKQAGVPVWTNAAVTRLIKRDGRIVGAALLRDGRAIEVATEQGVLLATGGFPGDGTLRRRYFAHERSGKRGYTLAPATNTGDGLRLAEEVGAALDETVSQPAAWSPVSLVPTASGPVPFPHYVDRAKPGFIAVDARGKRFCDEAMPYQRFVPAMMAACEPDAQVAVWLVADHRAVRRYGIGAAPPAPGRLGPFLRSEYLARAGNPAELAARIGVDAAGLVATLDTFNAAAARGEDSSFNKGSTPFDRAYGDAAWGPNPCLAPLVSPPFYAVKLHAGDIATFVGLRTDAMARVLGADGAPLPGLYAAGNDAASLFGGDYPAAGITIGAAMTFGYVAGAMGEVVR